MNKLVTNLHTQKEKVFQPQNENKNLKLRSEKEPLKSRFKKWFGFNGKTVIFTFSSSVNDIFNGV